MQLKNKTLIISLIMLCSISNVYAWGSETPKVDNESLNYGFDPIFNESALNDPYRYDTEEQQIITPSLRSNDALELCISYTLYKYEWSGTSYEKNTDCHISIEECVDLQYYSDSEGGYYGIPDNWESQVSDGYLVKRYFQSMLNAGNIPCAEYDNIDEVEKPDILEIEASADVGRSDLNEVSTGYLILDGDNEKELKRTQDHGFDINSMAGEGGSGELSNMVGWGNMDETSKEHKSIFGIFFYTLLPIIFILLVFSVMKKVL